MVALRWYLGQIAALVAVIVICAALYGGYVAVESRREQKREQKEYRITP